MQSLNAALRLSGHAKVAMHTIEPLSHMENGAITYRGAIYYQSASTKFERLNTIACVYEYAVDAEGNTSSKLYEWR
jgi:hypothetical protein